MDHVSSAVRLHAPEIPRAMYLGYQEGDVRPSSSLAKPYGLWEVWAPAEDLNDV